MLVPILIRAVAVSRDDRLLLEAVLLREAEVLGLDWLQASVTLGARVTCSSSFTVLAGEELVELVLDGFVLPAQLLVVVAH